MRLLASLTLIAILGAACGGSRGDDADAQEGALSQANDTDLFQNDRVGRMLRDNLGSVPGDYLSFERLFKIGRACERRDKKKEIFIVEEAQTRPINGNVDEQHNEQTDRLMPRAVITGCNTGDSSDSTTIRNSFSLMTALVSNQHQPNAAQGDTMEMTPLEVMALDDTTGLFNFYVFQSTDGGRPGSVSRFWRDKDGTVMTRKLFGGTRTPTDPAPASNKACFACHVNGAPLMNELSEPWTNWVSPKKSLPTSTMAGTTKELVAAASLADQLEGIIRSGTEAYVKGRSAEDGWLNRTRDGLLPGGTTKMLEPLFCQTELNYLSADTTLGVPLQVFFDPAVTSGAELILPDPPSGPTPTPFLFPIRAVRDEVTELALVAHGYLTIGMVVAIRLLDDENDVFSPTRCGIFAEVKAEIAKAETSATSKRLAPQDVQRILTSVIQAKLPSLKLQPARLEYLKARLTGADHQQKRPAYEAEVAERFGKLDLNISTREKARKDAARRMFPGPNPLPRLEPKQ